MWAQGQEDGPELWVMAAPKVTSMNGEIEELK